MNSEENKLRVLYLFNGGRANAFAQVQAGENPGDGFWGMVRLPRHGVEATYVEVEQIFPPWLARYIRKAVPVHFIHVPFFFRLFSCDIVFTSAAFGTQLLWTLWPGRKPLWIMHDFSIMSLIGNEKTFRQKIFAYMVSRCSGIVTVGKDETELLKRRFPHLKSRITYITFGVDPTFFAPAESRDREQVLSVGFDPDRDWKTLVEAMKGVSLETVLATRPGRIADLLPLPLNISQQTFTPRELAAEYARSEYFILPLDTRTGVNDAMGCSSLFEAMAAGCAIIASDTHTMRSYITHGENGLLVPERNVDALRHAVIELQKNAELRRKLGDAARAYALLHLDSEMLTRELAVFFKEVYAATRIKTASS